MEETPPSGEPLRVALVCDYSLDYLGGAQSAFLDEAELLRAAGAEVTIVAPATAGRAAGRSGALAGFEQPGRIEVPARLNLPVVDLPLVRNTRRLRTALREAFAERSIDIVHVHSEFGLTSAAIAAAAELGVPSVHTVHTFFWQTRMPRFASSLAAPAVRLFARWLRGSAPSRQRLAPSPVDSALRGITLATAKRARIVVSPSEHQAVRLREAGAGEVVTIPNALPDLPQHTAPLTSVDGALRIAWVGRLVPEKRILEFTEAAVRACERLGRGRLKIEVIGEGPQQAAAQQLSASTADITFHGRLGRELVRQQMRDAHLVALTSLGFDNQPVTVVEALSEARSVLYVDAALTEGLAEGGILAPAPDVAGMAEALVDLACSPEKVIEASARAGRAAAVFSPGRHAELLQDAYRSARS